MVRRFDKWAPFKSSAGKSLGKLIEGFKSSTIGRDLVLVAVGYFLVVPKLNLEMDTFIIHLIPLVVTISGYWTVLE